MKHIETTRLRLRSAGAFFIPEALICINRGRRGCGLHMSEPEKNPKAAGVAGMCKAASIATAAPETWGHGAGSRKRQKSSSRSCQEEDMAGTVFPPKRQGILYHALGMDALGNRLWTLSTLTAKASDTCRFFH